MSCEQGCDAGLERGKLSLLHVVFNFSFLSCRGDLKYACLVEVSENEVLRAEGDECREKPENRKAGKSCSPLLTSD